MPHRKHNSLVALIIAAPAALGCYDAEQLFKERQESTNVLRLEEVDLGAFRVSLPHVLGSAFDSVVDFHVFGNVSRRDRAAVAQALETRAPELRSRMLLSIRGMSDMDFEDPKLAKLREAIADVVNSALEKQLVKKVGFYHFELRRM